MQTFNNRATAQQTPDLEQAAPAAGRLSEDQRRRLSELYEANFAAVLGVCQRVLGSRDDAADATHEVFLRAMASLDNQTDSKRARAWLVAVARNHCIDIIRRRQRLGRALTTMSADAATSVDPERAVADREVVEAVLGQLRFRERQALWQSAVERRPLAEIAGYLGLSYMAAAQLLHRARRRAILVAARMAGILGLYRAGRGHRQQPVGGTMTIAQQLVVAAVVPLVLATVVSSSSAGPEARHRSADSAAVHAVSAPVVGQTGGVPSARPALPIPPAGTSSLRSAATSLERAITQLTGSAAPLLPSSLPKVSPVLPLPSSAPSLPPVVP